MKKFLPQVIPNTIIFVLIVSFIAIFKSIFGDINSSVGVTITVALLVLMQKDLTKNPVKNFLILLISNLSLGIIAHIAIGNMWIGIVINFVALGSIGYFLTKDLNKTIVLPFGLQYLFMLYEPVQGIDLRNRMMGLVFGAFIIMISQYIIHYSKNKSKASDKIEENQVLKSELCVSKQDNDDYEEIKLFGKIIYVHKARLLYAIKVGLLTSVTAFVNSYLEFNQGAWMTYTIFSLTEIYSEDTKVRSKKRVEGTIIGGLIVVILFFIFKDESSRTLIMLFAGYLNPFFKDYKHIIIIVTVSAVAPVAIAHGSILAVSQRIMFVVIGAILALAVNKIIHVPKPHDNELDGLLI